MNKPGEKLKKNSDFQKVYKHGRSFANRLLVVYVLFHPENPNRKIGFSISKKVGKAVQRNRIRRLLIEAYRLNQQLFREDLDLIIIPRKKIVGATYSEVEKWMIKLFRKAGILKNRM